jgi:peptidyl-prolyl cis-trans isomerase SurA
VKFFPLLCSLFVFTLPALTAEPQVLDGSFAAVNDEVITFSQVRELTTALENQINANYSGNGRTEKIKEVRLRAVNDLIDRQLIIQEFRKMKASIPSHVVDDRINAVIRDEFGGDRSAFLRTIAAQGYSIDRIRKMEEEKVIVQAMRQREVKGDPIIPVGKVESYYRQHAQEWTQGDEVKLKMIKFVSDGPNGKKLKMLQEIREKIVRGADFGDMARIYSEDNTQDSNGDWGWVKRGDLSAEFDRVVFTLKPGKVSDVVAIGPAFYLFLAEQKKGGVTKPLAEMRAEIERRLIQEERQKMQQAWLAKLRKKAYIKIY